MTNATRRPSLRIAILALSVALAAPALADGPVAQQSRSVEEGAFFQFEYINQNQSCIVDGVEQRESAFAFANVSNQLWSYDLSTRAPGVLFNFLYDNPCGSTHLFPYVGTGVTDPTAYGDPEWAAQYISFQGKVDDRPGPDGKLAWARIDRATFPVWMESDGCYLLATLTLNGSAVAPLEKSPPNLFVEGSGPGFTRTHVHFEHRPATATGTLALTAIDPGCPVPPNPMVIVANAPAYAPWGDLSSFIYRSRNTTITVAPRGTP